MSDINPEIFRNLFKQLKNQKNEECENMINLELEKGDNFDRAMEERSNALLIKLKSRTSIFIKKIDMALDRIEDGSFGKCEECEDNISRDRLFARPTAQLCILCKEVQEKVENNLLYSKRSHTLGKSLISEITLTNCHFGIDGGSVVKTELQMLGNLAVM
jgi:DnaK suppressor protein